MNTLAIYDSTGYIITQMSGSVREPIGIPFMWIEIPEKKKLTLIDVTKTPNVPIFEDVPLTEEEKLKIRVDATESALMALMDMQLI